VVSHRRELARLELLCEDHPVTCGCEDCYRLIVLAGELAGGDCDPDDMQDEDEPFFWNR
jgi:hypothetical protein